MKYMRFLLACLFVFALIRGNATDIVIRYTIHKDSTSMSMVSNYLLGINRINSDRVDLNSQRDLPAVKTVLNVKPGLEVVTFRYTIDKDGMYCISDLFFHRVFLDHSMSRDTVDLELYRVKNVNNRLYLNDSISSPWFYRIQYPRKFRYMGFFDSLTCVTGDLYNDSRYTFKRMNHDLPAFLDVTNRNYKARLRFLKEFSKENPFPAKFAADAFSEIQAVYYHTLLTTADYNPQLLDSFPPYMRDTLVHMKNNLNNAALYENTSQFRYVISGYIYARSKEFMSKPAEIPDSIYVTDRVKYCLSHLTGKNRGYALAKLMQIISMRHAPKEFSYVYAKYDHATSAPGVNEFVDSLYRMVVIGVPLTAQELAAYIFEDSSHARKKFAELVDKPLALVDLWATWCGPCIKQMPYLDSMSLLYKDKVRFISVSGDQFGDKWDSWLVNTKHRNQVIRQMHAAGGFEHPLLKRLLINAIPRYILISHEGKILEVAMPYPGETDLFKQKIDHYLKGISE